MTEASGPRLAVVVKGFPRLSETFIARELAALEARGIDFALVSLRHPGSDAKLVDNRVKAKPHYLPEYLHDEPARVWRAFNTVRRWPKFRHVWRAFLDDLPRDVGRARPRRLGQACVLATELPSTVRHIHAHFAHSPASVVRYAAKMRGLSYSISAHAKDIWTAPEWDLREKLAEASFVAVCNTAGADRLRALHEGNIQLVHHGVPAETLGTAKAQSRDGTNALAPVRIVCVARAVEKKGLRTLVAALAQVPKGTAFEMHHIGGGPLLGELKRLAQNAGVAAKITWHGSKPHADVVAMLDRSDLFVLPGSVASDGDRDGIPNAVLEAQARGLPVIATASGGIAEAVRDGTTARLVPPGDPQALASALQALIQAPAARTTMGAAGLANVRDHFDAESGYDRIANLLRPHLD